MRIIDVKDWNRRLQEAIEGACPGKHLRIEENTTSISRLIRESLERRGIIDRGDNEYREIIAKLKASNICDDIAFYIGAFGGQSKQKVPKASGIPSGPNPSKSSIGTLSIRKVVKPLKQIFEANESVDIFDRGFRMPGSFGSTQ